MWMFLEWGRMLLEFVLSLFSLQLILHDFVIWLSLSRWLRALYFAFPIFCPCECWHGGIKKRELQSNSHNPNSNPCLHQRQNKSDRETELFWMFLGFLSVLHRNANIFRLQVEEVRLLWLCFFNIHYFMMKEIIKESCDVSTHSKIALNPRINVHKPCISFFNSIIYIIFMSALRKWERY